MKLTHHSNDPHLILVFKIVLFREKILSVQSHSCKNGVELKDRQLQSPGKIVECEESNLTLTDSKVVYIAHDVSNRTHQLDYSTYQQKHVGCRKDVQQDFLYQVSPVSQILLGSMQWLSQDIFESLSSTN